MGRGRPRRSGTSDQGFRELDVHIQPAVHRVMVAVVRELREQKPRGAQRDHRHQGIVLADVERREFQNNLFYLNQGLESKAKRTGFGTVTFAKT